MRRNFPVRKGGERGKILNSTEVGSQIFATPHCPSCKLSKNASFVTIGQVEVVENEGELSVGRNESGSQVVRQ